MTAFTALVEFQVRPENCTTAEWLEVWDKRAQDARDHEPGTLSYGAAVNLENELNVLVYERYANNAEAVQAHTDRPAHGELMTALGERRMTKRRIMGTRFTDIAEFGWWSRPDKAADAEGNLIVLIGMRFENDDARDKFIELSAGHADYCLANEPDTLIYNGGLADDDTDREIDAKAGDLIFVMGCADAAAMEKHRDDPNHIALGARFAEAGVNLNVTFIRTYRTTGKGYLWR